MIQHAPNLNSQSAIAAERQMRNWALGLETHDRLGGREKAGEPSPPLVRPYLAISRESGAGGGAVAEQLHHLLGWDVFGRELLDGIAQRCKVPHLILNALDESTPNFLGDRNVRQVVRPAFNTPSGTSANSGWSCWRRPARQLRVHGPRRAVHLAPAMRACRTRGGAAGDANRQDHGTARKRGRNEAEAFVRDTDRRPPRFHRPAIRPRHQRSPPLRLVPESPLSRYQRRCRANCPGGTAALCNSGQCVMAGDDRIDAFRLSKTLA